MDLRCTRPSNLTADTVVNYIIVADLPKRFPALPGVCRLSTNATSCSNSFCFDCSCDFKGGPLGPPSTRQCPHPGRLAAAWPRQLADAVHHNSRTNRQQSRFGAPQPARGQATIARGMSTRAQDSHISRGTRPTAGSGHPPSTMAKQRQGERYTHPPTLLPLHSFALCLHHHSYAPPSIAGIQLPLAVLLSCPVFRFPGVFTHVYTAIITISFRHRGGLVSHVTYLGTLQVRNRPSSQVPAQPLSKF